LFKNKVYCQESFILIMLFNCMATLAAWLDGSFESWPLFQVHPQSLSPTFQSTPTPLLIQCMSRHVLCNYEASGK